MADLGTHAGRMSKVHTRDHSIINTQVERSLLPTMENQELMPDEHRFRNDRAKARGAKSDPGYDHRDEKNDDIAQTSNTIRTHKTLNSG